MSVTLPVSQLEMSWSKALVTANTVWKKGVREETVFKHHYNLLPAMLVTAPVSQPEMFWLKSVFSANTGKRRCERRNSFQTYHYNLLSFMSSTREVSQLPMTPYEFPVTGSIEAARTGQDPSAVSAKQTVTTAFKLAVFAGVNTA